MKFTGVTTIATAMGAVAIGVFAIGALAIGRLAIRHIAVETAKFKSLEIQDLTVTRLRVTEVTVTDSIKLPDIEIVRQPTDGGIMSRESRMSARSLLVVLPSVMYGGGITLLGMLMERTSGYSDNPLRQNLGRAGHAHAGVYLVLSVVILLSVDEAILSPFWK
jgi:hypothetical protein